MEWWCLGIVLSLFLGAGQGLETLFSWDEPVIQFTADNFTENVQDSDTAWMVDFYATWCGHCQRFAPTWVQFARDAQGWSRVVKIGAIACSDPQNSATCRDYGVRGYPTVKFLAPRSQTTGRLVSGRKTVSFLSHTTIDYLMQSVRDTHNPLPTSLTASWPRLEPFGSLREISSASSSAETRYIFVIAEDPSSLDNDPYMTRELILSMSAYYPAIFIARMLRRDAEREGVETYPSLNWHRGFFLDQVEGVNTKAAMLDFIRGYAARLTSGNSGSQDTTATTVPDVTTPPSPISTAGPSDGIHMQDLESSIYYSLWIEVGGQSRLEGDMLQALKDHISVMAKYHPGRTHIVNFLRRVSDWLAGQEQLTGGQWKDSITALQTADAYVPDRVSWTGCGGSQPRFRGYPCSLWMTFHSLTVNSLDVAGRFPSFDPEEVLRAMKGYIYHFFGCRECAGHFGRMAATMEEEVTSRTDGITWLWGAHNRANNRLHLDPTEDPVHPKVQFPRHEACSSCRTQDEVLTEPFNNNTSWDPQHILSFLRMFYGKMNVIQDALPFQFVAQPEGPTPIPPRTTSTNIPDPPEREQREQLLTEATQPDAVIMTSPTPAAPSCEPRHTLWSPCSKTCDVGVSTRLSNEGSQACQMRMQMRLCNVRPCVAVEIMRRNYRNPQQGQRCEDIGATFRVTTTGPLTYGNCHSIENFFGREYGSKICGLCPGRCCYPSEERTLELHMQCGEHYGRVKVQHIDRCECPVNCPENYRLWYFGGQG